MPSGEWRSASSRESKEAAQLFIRAPASDCDWRLREERRAMTTMLRRSASLGLAAALAAGSMAATSVALADAPTVTVGTNPAGPIIELINPGLDPVQVSAGLGHSPNLNSIQAFDLLVDGGSGFASIIGGPKNPYTGGNACDSTITSLANLVSCATNNSNAGTITVSWTPAVGVYIVRATARHGGNTGTDDEEVTIVQETVVSVEYPAPPAVANEYINSKYKRISGSCRGYIISTIAGEHAKDEKYGDKGGPYDEDLIYEDVEYYKEMC